jgi:hypothetical protein
LRTIESWITRVKEILPKWPADKARRLLHSAILRIGSGDSETERPVEILRKYMEGHETSSEDEQDYSFEEVVEPLRVIPDLWISESWPNFGFLHTGFVLRTLRSENPGHPYSRL